jgi:hypothetical protein
MTITIDPELENRIRLVAAQHGQDVAHYAVEALLRQVAADEAPPSEHSLRLEFEAAAHDPLFLADIQEIEEAFRSADAQTAAMLDHD